MAEMVLFQMVLEYGFLSDNVFALHREFVDFGKEIINENGGRARFRVKAKEERREKLVSLFLLGRK